MSEKKLVQKPVILNLTKQEAQCLKLVLEYYRKQIVLSVDDLRPRYPFVDRLQAKLIL